jgi:hypothetical protein
MKKSIFIIAATALVISCASNDVKNDILQEEMSIGFDSFSSLATKSSSAANLEAYHQTFGVWGYKTVNASESAVMERIVSSVSKSYQVKYNDSGNGSADWDYDGTAGSALGQFLKYWDKTASKYQFDAYAPYSDNASISNHVISIANGQYAANENLQATLSETLNTEVFSGDGSTSTTASTDWMMPAASYIRNASGTPSTMSSDIVNLDFKHILSKVIIVVKTKDNFPFNITLNSLSLNNVYGSGSYNGTAWTTSGSAVSVNGVVGEMTKSTTATNHKYYTIECLVMPQATAAPKFSVNYTIGEDPEIFNVVEQSISGITSFAAGTAYIITATIGPDPINFDCTVTDWTANEAGSVTVE